MTFYRNLILAALVLAFGVVSLGAYVRLSDAGLGCPDWPGCYGKLTPHHAAGAIDAELAEHPGGPVSHAKAWKEMVHRYFAGTLGLLVLGIAVLGWRRRTTGGGPGLPMLLLGLVVFQAMLGMWTVTQLLKPLVVSAHLLGGMSTLALLLWLWLRERGRPSGAYPARRRFGNRLPPISLSPRVVFPHTSGGGRSALGRLPHGVFWEYNIPQPYNVADYLVFVTRLKFQKENRPRPA